MSIELLTGAEVKAQAAKGAKQKKHVAKKLGEGLAVISVKIAYLCGPEKTADILRSLATAMENQSAKTKVQSTSMGFSIPGTITSGFGMGIGLSLAALVYTVVRGILATFGKDEKKI